MTIRDAAEQIKRTVPMTDILSLYGYTTDRAGFMRCPFHAGDHTASLKVYKGARGWSCFGCHAGGTQIDFVMRSDNIGFADAVRKIDDDLRLHLTDGPVEGFNAFFSRQRAESAAMLKYQDYIENLKQANDEQEHRLLAWFALYLQAYRKAPQDRTASDWDMLNQQLERGFDDWRELNEQRRKEAITFYEFNQQASHDPHA